MVCCPAVREPTQPASLLYYKTQVDLYLPGLPPSSVLPKKQQRKMAAVGGSSNPLQGRFILAFFAGGAQPQAYITGDEFTAFIRYASYVSQTTSGLRHEIGQSGEALLVDKSICWGLKTAVLALDFISSTLPKTDQLGKSGWLSNCHIG